MGQAMTEAVQPWGASALDLVRKRYLSGQSLTVEAWLRTVADSLTHHHQGEEREAWSDRYYRIFHSRAFLPTSAILYNALRDDPSLAACVVFPLPSEPVRIFGEALPAILESLLAGTGVGLDLTPLAPRLSHDPSTGRAYPGPVELGFAIMGTIQHPVAYSGLKRAAFMASLAADHPDVFEFTTAKLTNPLPSVNTSVAIDAAFREAVARDGWLPLTYVSSGRPVYLEPSELEAMAERARQRSVPPPDLTPKVGPN